jgi:phage terminase large subunit
MSSAAMAVAQRRHDALAEARKGIARWRESPELFCREALGVTSFEAWQLEALEAYATQDRISIRSGHGVGKSAMLSWIVLHFLCTRFPCKVPVTGSNYDQLKATLWAELAAWFRRMPQSLQDQWELGAESIAMRAAPRESFAVLRTASKERAQNLAGFHSENVLVVVDEASAVDDLIYEVLGGALTTAGAKLLLTGNPTQGAGYFFRSHNENRAQWWTRKVSCLDVDRVSPAWVEEQRLAYGEQSNVFRVRVLGEFPRSDEDGVIPLDLIEAAVGRPVGTIDVRPIWGLDVARYGDDSTALAKRQGNSLMEPVREWRNKDTQEVAGIVLNEWMETPANMRPSAIAIDVIGIGAGVFDVLKRVERLKDNGTVVSAVNVAEGSSRSERYERLRDQLWFDARDWFAARDCKLADDQPTMGELAGPRYKIQPSGKLKVESKDDMKARGIRSPNRADAFVMTFAPVEMVSRTTARRAGMLGMAPVTRYDETRHR